MISANTLRALCTFLLLMLPSVAHAQAWWDNSWTWRQQLLIGNAGTTANVTNFPVMVKLDTSRVPYGTFKSGGADIRFVAADQASPLPYEIEVWNASGTSILWVKLPTLLENDTSGGEIWMYWGNAAATDGQQATSVWQTAYEAVWHLQNLSQSTDVPGGGTLTQHGGAAAVAGQIGGAYSLDGNDDYFSQSIDLGTWMTDADGTLEFWIKTDDAGTAGPADSGAVGLMGVHGGSNSDFHFGWIKSGSPKSVCISADDNAGKCANAVDNTWHYVVFERDGASSGAGDVDVYLDGTRIIDSQAAGGGAHGVTFSDIGRIGSLSSSNIAASVDEIRILSTKTNRGDTTTVGASTSWVTGNYKSQTDALIGWTCSAATWYRDADGDTFGTPSTTVSTCGSPRSGSGWVSNSTDCNDLDALVNPNTLWYVDADLDTYGVTGATIAQCTDPSGASHYAPRAGDNCDAQPLAWTSGACATCNDTDGDNAWEQCDAYTGVGADSCDTQPLAWTSGACATCVDTDGDTAWAACDTYTGLGADCNNNNARTWNTCGTCLDADTDTHWTGCNAYLGVTQDCSDSNSRTWDTCGTCADGDTDGHWAGCNAYPLGDGPDACEGLATNVIARNNWDTTQCGTCADGDGDGKYSACNTYATITQDFCDVDGQVIDENNYTTAGCNPTTGCKDRDGDGKYSACDNYLTIFHDFCDVDGQVVDENNYTSASCNLTTGCKDRDGDGKYSVCDTYLTITQDFCDVDNQVVDENNYTSASCNPTTGCKDRDGDGKYSVCDTYLTITRDYCDVDGQPIDENNFSQTACGGGCADGDGDGKYSGCDTYVTLTHDFCDVNNQVIDENNWTSTACGGGCKDADIDTYYTACDAYLTIQLDCNDTTASITTGVWYRDFDGDAHGDALVTGPGCTQPSGYVANNDDCDDHNASKHLDDGDGITFTQEDDVGADNCSADSDRDGIGDAIEWGGPGGSPAQDSDDDGTPDIMDEDDDGDGLLTEFEPDDDLDGAPECGFAPDGIPAYLDVDSDGDGVCDGIYVPIAAECADWTTFDREPLVSGLQTFPEYSSLDNDNDGVPNAYDFDDFDGGACDADGDGLPSLYEASTCYTPPAEAEVCLDPADSDTDGDGVPDGLEVGSDTAHPLDSDLDLVPDWGDLDDDGDLVPTLAEDYGAPPDGDPTNDQTDGDGIPDYLDPDDDGDGVLTMDEDRDGDLDPRDDDTDGDGLADYLDADDGDGPQGDHDHDTIANADEEAAGTDPEDSDSDGDGVLDGLEWSDDLGDRLDTDGDTIFDVLDPDDDGDGIPTAVEGAWDADEDGVANYLDIDADDDGATDRAEGGDSWEADGTLPDTDSDGVPDFLDPLADKFDTGGGTGPGPVDDDAGCACGVVPAPASGLGALWLLALAGLRRRRRESATIGR